MCGFVGEISLEGTVQRAALVRMARSLAHRGPDEEGAHVSGDGRWGVAHRRLCILDREGGRQPFAARGCSLVYNGEIYEEQRLRADLRARGWEFRSNSDTEVLLALYVVHGKGFLAHLRGEFAFALFDEGRREALLVRDRLGLKPLYWTRLPKALLFASEAKGLFQDPRVSREWDPVGLCGAIAVAETPGRTIFKGVRQLPNAHVMTVSLDTLEAREERYWDPWEARRRDLPADFAGQREAVRAAVDEAIDLRLRSDVPVGTYLSGGVDSSIVTARTAAKLGGVDAFGISYRSSPQHDEWPHAVALAAAHPSVRLHEIPLDTEKIVAGVPATAWYLEKPFANTHTVAKVLAARHVRESVGCLLTGDGGDEAFCGYPTFWLQHALEASGYRVSGVRRALRERRREEKTIGSNAFFLRGITGRRLRKTEDLDRRLGFRPVELVTAAHRFRWLKALMRRDFVARIKVSPVMSLVKTVAPWMPREKLPHDVLLHHLHLVAFGPEYIASLADRTEYAGSVEARPPLFDHRLIELAMGLPMESMVKGDREKHVLREAFSDVLPPALRARRKQSFLLPPAPFTSPAGRALLDRYLSPSAVEAAGVFRPVAVRLARALGQATLLTIMLTTQIVHRHLIAEPSAEPPLPPYIAAAESVAFRGMASRRRKTARGADVERQVEYLRRLLQRAESRRRAGGRDSAQTLRVQIGYQFEKVGQWSRAVREYGRALVSAKGRRGPRAAQMLASLRHRIGALAARRGHPKQAVALLAAGRRGLKRALRRWPDEDELVRRFGDIVLLLAEVRAVPDAHAATRTLGSLVRDLDAFVLRNPGSLAGQRQLADACAALADSWEDRHRGEEDRVEPLRKRAASIYGTLMGIAPDDGVREALSRVLTDLGHDAVIRCEARKAQRLLEEALRLLLAMGRLDLALEDEPLRLAGLYSWLGYALARRGDVDGARSAQLTSWAAVEAAARRGVKGGRRRREWAELFADSCTESCLELLKLGAADRPWEAPALLRRAHGFLKTLAERRIIAPGSARDHGRWLDEQAADL